jgi:signal transduction histidine kinase
MAHARTALLGLLPWLVGGCLVACRPSAAQLDEEQWHQAESQWQRSDPGAYRTWRRLNAEQPHGRVAWMRLGQADLRYRRAVDLVRTGEPGLRETLTQALALAPMDPALYLPFARACRDRGSLWRAEDFYRKYLARNPSAPEADAARAELAAIGTDRDPFPPDFDQQAATSASPPDQQRWWLRSSGLGAAGLVLTMLGVLALLVLRRRGGDSLRAIVAARPELHQAVAYQIGCLRHEFLKHRIGAAGEALLAVLDGKATPEQHRFLAQRLREGEPLLAAWRAHVVALDRSLGLARSLLRTDPVFRRADRALKAIGRGRQRRARHAYGTLRRLDCELGELVARLASCHVDEAFLRDVLASTRSEWSSGRVDLDEVVVGPVPGEVAVDVYRTDLRIVLKNIVRNAIASLADSPHPRRLAIDVLVEMEPTGEDVVRIRVRDSGGGSFADPGGAAVDVEHGLGIVQSALRRYDGSLEVMSGDGVYAKAFGVRLFASQGRPSRIGRAA